MQAAEKQPDAPSQSLSRTSWKNASLRLTASHTEDSRGADHSGHDETVMTMLEPEESRQVRLLSYHCTVLLTLSCGKAVMRVAATAAGG